MTSDQRERQIEAMQDILILYPEDLLELIAFVTDEQTRGVDPCDHAPLFPEEEV